MDKEELKSRINDPKVKIIDVRREKGEKKILNARPEDPENPESWMNNYTKDDILLLYCSWNNENTSAGTAQKFIENGFQDVYALKGGWNEWRDAGYPTEPLIYWFFD